LFNHENSDGENCGTYSKICRFWEILGNQNRPKMSSKCHFGEIFGNQY